MRVDRGDSKWVIEPHNTDTGDSGKVADGWAVSGETVGLLLEEGTMVDDAMDAMDEDGVGDSGKLSRGDESVSGRLLDLVGEMGSGGRPDHTVSVLTSSASHDTGLVLLLHCSPPPSICLPSSSLCSFSSLNLFLPFSACLAVLHSLSRLLSSFMNSTLYHGFLGARTHSMNPPLTPLPPPTTGGVVGRLSATDPAAAVGGVRGAMVGVWWAGLKLQRRQWRLRRLASRREAR